jgi:hypothetical protein
VALTINAEPRALNHVTQTSSGRTLLSPRGVAALVASFAAVGLGSASPRVAQAAGVVSCAPNGEQNLRDAINQAHAGDTVQLDGTCIYTLTSADNQDPTQAQIQGDSGLIIKKKLTINGNGATITRLSSAPPFRIFLVAKDVGDLTLDNVIVVNGNAVSQDVKRGRGGGIANLGNLTVQGGSVLSHNNADFAGGAICNGDANYAPQPVKNAVLHLRDSTISGNSAGLVGGGIANGGDQNQIILTGCKISGNTGGTGSGGGGIASQGTATLTDCIVSRNTASDGGGIISIGTLTLNGSRVTGNSATGMVSAPSGFGGGIYNLAGVLTVDKSNNSNSLIAFNSATNDGGGIVNAPNATAKLYNNSVVSRNYTASEGGGIANGGTMTLSTNSDVTANNAVQNGGGIANKLGIADITLDHSDVTDNGTIDDRTSCGGIFNAPPHNSPTNPGNKVTLMNGSQVHDNFPDNQIDNCPPAHHAAQFSGPRVGLLRWLGEPQQ